MCKCRLAHTHLDEAYCACDMETRSQRDRWRCFAPLVVWNVTRNFAAQLTQVGL
jgi:hypothetical protein